MMTSPKSLLIGGVALLLCVQIGYAVKCYQCNSADGNTKGDACKDPFDNDSNDIQPENCPNNATVNGHRNSPAIFCRKTIQKTALSGMKEESRRIIRSCGYEEEDRLKPDDESSKGNLKCYRRVGTFEVEMLYCACYEDGCNSGGRPEPFAVLFIALLHQVFIRL